MRVFLCFAVVFGYVLEVQSSGGAAPARGDKVAFTGHATIPEGTLGIVKAADGAYEVEVKGMGRVEATAAELTVVLSQARAQAALARHRAGAAVRSEPGALQQVAQAFSPEHLLPEGGASLADADVTRLFAAIDLTVRLLDKDFSQAIGYLNDNRKKLADGPGKGLVARLAAQGPLKLSDVFRYEAKQPTTAVFPDDYKVPKHKLKPQEAELAEPSAAMAASWCARILGMIGSLLTEQVAANPAGLKDAGIAGMAEWLEPGIYGFGAWVKKKALKAGLGGGLPKTAEDAAAFLQSMNAPEPPRVLPERVAAAGAALRGFAEAVRDLLRELQMDEDRE